MEKTDTIYKGNLNNKLILCKSQTLSLSLKNSGLLNVKVNNKY